MLTRPRGLNDDDVDDDDDEDDDDVDVDDEDEDEDGVGTPCSDGNAAIGLPRDSTSGVGA